jgi:hypothetical protein
VTTLWPPMPQPQQTPYPLQILTLLPSFFTLDFRGSKFPAEDSNARPRTCDDAVATTSGLQTDKTSATQEKTHADRGLRGRQVDRRDVVVVRRILQTADDGTEGGASAVDLGDRLVDLTDHVLRAEDRTGRARVVGDDLGRCDVDVRDAEGRRADRHEADLNRGTFVGAGLELEGRTVRVRVDRDVLRDFDERGLTDVDRRRRSVEVDRDTVGREAERVARTDGDGTELAVRALRRREEADDVALLGRVQLGNLDLDRTVDDVGVGRRDRDARDDRRRTRAVVGGGVEGTDLGVRGDDRGRVRRRLEARVAAVEQRLTVEVRVRGDLVDFLDQLRDFVLQRRTVGGRRDRVRGFDRERTNALQDVGHGLQGAVGDVRRVGRVLDVQVRGVETGRLILQIDRDREARRIVGCGVDAEAAGELIDQLPEALLVPIEVKKGGVGQQVVGYGNTANGIRHEFPP